MILPLDKKALYLNIENDTMDKGSAAGDVILVQDTDGLKNNELKELIYRYNEFLPIDEELLNEKSLKSVKNPDNTKILGAYVFDNFSVNNIPFSSEKNFLIFIRQSLVGKKKVTLIFQASRKLPSKNIDNGVVFDDLSKTINNQGFRVDAFNYIEKENRLDFIVNLYGFNAVTSEVFFDDAEALSRVLKGFSEEDVSKWSDLQFTVNCLYLLKKYGLEIKSPLLENEDYCEKRFGLYPILIKNKDNKANYSNEEFYFNNDYYHILTSWENIKGRSSRKIFWEWLLDHINEVSSDVQMVKKSQEIDFLRIPDYYENSLEDIGGEIEISFDIEINDLKNIEQEEFLGQIKIKNSRKFLNHRNYFKNQNLKINDEVILINTSLTKILFNDVYKIKAFKEQSFILTKSNCYINKDSKQEFLNLIKEDLNG